jgi:hypothetical protein
VCNKSYILSSTKDKVGIASNADVSLYFIKY